MKKYFISVLVTNFNKEFFLKNSLKKICNQTYKKYEIILFDDCSTDNSLNIIKKYKKIKLTNFGTFFIKSKKSRLGRNPKTKEQKLISKRNVVIFKPSKEFKTFINLRNNG